MLTVPPTTVVPREAVAPLWGGAPVEGRVREGQADGLAPGKTPHRCGHALTADGAQVEPEGTASVPSRWGRALQAAVRRPPQQPRDCLRRRKPKSDRERDPTNRKNNRRKINMFDRARYSRYRNTIRTVWEQFGPGKEMEEAAVQVQAGTKGSHVTEYLATWNESITIVRRGSNVCVL